MQNRTHLARMIVEFCRFVRANGLAAGMQQTLAALAAAQSLPGTDDESFQFALRSTLCSTKEEWDLFDGLFAQFWRGSPYRARTTEERQSWPSTNSPAPLTSLGKSLLIPGLNSSGKPEGSAAIAGASAQERLKTADFSSVPQSDLPALEKLSLRLLRQMSVRLSRRLKISQAGQTVDLRRTIRANVHRGGELLQLRHKAKKPRPAPLVILLDISGSMNPYSLFLVRFAYALQKHFKRVETFLFSTALVRITGLLRARQLPLALGALSQQAAGWSGGTKIGGCLGEFNRLHGRKLLSRDALFIVLSDGWDTGDPKALAAGLAAVRRRVRKVIWLNPLLGLKDYQPLTRGMSAALPYIDVFAPGHNLESLLALERHL
jgi:uncharacterized protein